MRFVGEFELKHILKLNCLIKTISYVFGVLL